MIDTLSIVSAFQKSEWIDDGPSRITPDGLVGFRHLGARPLGWVAEPRYDASSPSYSFQFGKTWGDLLVMRVVAPWSVNYFEVETREPLNFA